MTLAAEDRNRWMLGGGIALAGHVSLVAAVLLAGGHRPREVSEDPVVLVELRPLASPAPAVTTQEPVAETQPEYTPQPSIRPIAEAPQVRTPLPREFVSVPPPRPPLPAQRAPAAVQRPVEPASAVRPTPAEPSTNAGTGTAAVAGDDPKAKREEADYYSLLSAHLNRKKRYPTEAKKARQQGVVTVRFTVHSNGSISSSSIRKSSGHALLDQATLDLMQRVAPLPKFPESMTKDSVTISLPIDYSLRTR